MEEGLQSGWKHESLDPAGSALPTTAPGPARPLLFAEDEGSLTTRAVFASSSEATRHRRRTDGRKKKMGHSLQTRGNAQPFKAPARARRPFVQNTVRFCVDRGQIPG